MLREIKNKVEAELFAYRKNLLGSASLNRISPLLFKYISDFICRDGKRVRPMLFVISYLGFSKKPAADLYKTALSVELLHDFMLVHDDIIDKSDTRRGKPSMHKLFNNYLAQYKGVKFNGQDLTIVAGDVLYALGLDAFLSIKEDPKRKELALRQLIKAALYTGAGEFIELLSGIKDMERIMREDIYKIYDYKTAYYSFSSPLAIGAILAGAKGSQIEKLIQYGIYLGRAFQIKDDILGIFGKEKKIGKSTLTDLQEAKKTLLIWHAFTHADRKNQAVIRKILSKEKTTRIDLLTVRKIIAQSGALDYAKNEVTQNIRKAQEIIAGVKLKTAYKDLLKNYSAQVLQI